MKSIILPLIGLFFLVYSSKPTVNLKPFSVSFETPYLPFAILFLAISISLFQFQAQKNEYRKGFNDGVDLVIDFAKEKRKKQD